MIDRQHKKGQTPGTTPLETRNSVRALMRGMNARRVRCTRSFGAGICNARDGVRLGL